MKIKGNASQLSREEVRALIYACDCILRYHNLKPRVRVYELEPKIKLGDKYWGYYLDGHAQICRDTEWSQMATLIIHETLHSCIYDNNGDEKIISTLTARLKEDVIKLANILVENTYKRAAFIAHTKISYRPKGKDFYDDAQYHRRHLDSNGKKYRRNAKLKPMESAV